MSTKTDEPKKKHKPIPGMRFLRVLNWSLLLLPILFVVSALNDWNTLGLVAFVLFGVLCVCYPITLGVVTHASKKIIAQAKEDIEEAKRVYAQAYVEERRNKPLVINDPALARFYQEVTSELDARVAQTSLKAYFEDPYCVVRQSVALNIAELVGEDPDATLSSLVTKVSQDEFYNREGEWTEAEAEYAVMMTRIQHAMGQVAN